MRLRTEQIKAARMLLGWDQLELAEAAELSPVTIKRIEAVAGEVQTTTKTEMKIRVALERAGVVLIEEDDDGGPGARLGKRLSMRSR